MRRWTIAVVLAASLLAACTPGAPWAQTHPAAKTVARALELRSARSRDASAYAQLFADPAVADALASEAVSAGVDPLAPHDAPYVSAAETAGADVIVVWHPAKGDARWPASTVFKVRLADGTWRIADALPLEASSTPEPMARP